MRDKVDRIEEALHQTALSMKEHQGDLRVLTANVQQVSDSVGTMASSLGNFDTRYASKTRFELVERVVFSAAAIILLAFFSALVKGGIRFPWSP